MPRKILIATSTFISATIFCLLFSSSAKAQSDGGFVVLPMASFNGDQGIGIGGEIVWSKISGTEWLMRGGGFYSFNYATSVLGLGLQNRKLADRFFFSLGLFTSNTNKSLFYGYGNRTSLEDPTQFSMQTFGAETKLGVNITEAAVFGFGFGSSTTSVGRGSRDNETQYIDRYSDRRFVRGSDATLGKIFLMYDDMEPELAPDAGTRALLQYEQGLGGEPEISKLQAGASHIIPITDASLLAVLRTDFDRTWGGDNPFFQQSRLGGSNTLRGYRIGRWTDSASILYGAEVRWRVWEIGGFFQRMEWSFAYETGRVFNDGAINVLFDELRPSFVGGITLVFSSGTPIRLDVAQSPEGYQTYLHLLHPF